MKPASIPRAVVTAVERLLLEGRATTRRSAAAVLLAAPVYGLAMGSIGDLTLSRLPIALIAAAKLPILLLVSALVCLPAYACALAIVGCARDIRAACRVVFQTQAVVALALASLAPVILIAYTATDNHTQRILANAVVFAAALAAGQRAARRRLAPLRAANPIHSPILLLWGVLYAFVSIQLAWTLRPFVGPPGTPAQFFRDNAFTNAYVVLAGIVQRALGL